MSASANVRSLLRSERKSRRIEHPHATYSSNGVLGCQLCHISIKAESLWNQHIHGSHHRGQLQRLRAREASRAVANANAAKSPTEAGVSSIEPNRKKRKADDDEDIDDEEVEDAARKKTRADAASSISANPLRVDDNHGIDRTSPDKPSVIDEAEWEAFNREMASSPPMLEAAGPSSALIAAATITVAPVSAAELAARSREEASTQTRSAREVEAEGEREDATQRIEEEFEEQEQLQERVKKLKEKREALRSSEATKIRAEAKIDTTSTKTPILDAVLPKEAAEDNKQDDDEDSEEDDDWAMWPR